MDYKNSALRALLQVPIGICLSFLCLFVPSAAEANLRSTFPGRRVGGGTRGECTSRILAHLVPASSVYSPGVSGVLGLVQGPATKPVGLTMTFQPQTGGAASSRALDASNAGLILVRMAVLKEPVVWQSGFDCASKDDLAQSDPLVFVEALSPPAVSLLLREQEPSDAVVQVALQALLQRCGATVPTRSTLAKFGLVDVVTARWPEQLPVRCPG